MIAIFKNRQRTQYYLIAFFCFVLLLHQPLATLVVIALIINTIAGLFDQSFSFRYFTPTAFLFCSIYILYALSMIYTQNWESGWSELESKLSFLVFPFIFFTMPPIELKWQAIFIKSFVIGCGIATLWMLTAATLDFYINDHNSFYNLKLGRHINGHPPYIALYLIFSILSILYLFYYKPIYLNQIEKWIFGGVILFLFIMLFPLASRTAIGIFTVMLLSVGFFESWRKKRLRRGITIAHLVVLSIFILIKIFSGSNSRFEKIVVHHKDPRSMTWSAALELITAKPILGYGVGDVRDELVHIYKRDNYKIPLKHRFDAHNQYLETTIAIGIVGLLLLLVIFFVPLYQSWKHLGYLQALFITIIIIGCITESLLERQAGIFFYGSFNSLFAQQFTTK